MENISILIKLIEERDLQEKMLKEMKENISLLRHGSIFIKNNLYYYLKYYEKGKVISIYLGTSLNKDEIEKIKKEDTNYKILKKRIKESRITIQELNKQIKHFGGEKYGY